MANFIGTEATGVYVGTLVEDMIETVKREKKLYCKVHIPDFFAKDSDYPLTYVPFWAMSLPLREGDKVMVEFHQCNLMYPVLYKNPDEIDKQFYEKFNIPNGVTGGRASQPTAVDTIGAFKLGENSYVIKTDNYTLIHQGDNGYICIDNDGKTYIQGTDINIIANGKLNIDASGDIKLTNTGTGNIDIKSGSGSFTVNSHLKVTV